MIIKDNNSNIFDILDNFYLNNNVPVKVKIDLTNKCNCNCLFCFHGSSHVNDEPELTYSELTVLLKKLKRMGTRTILYMGGEPFIRKDILDILTYTRKLGFLVEVVTNGHFLNKEIIDYLHEIYISGLCISVHSVNKQSYMHHFGIKEFNLTKLLEVISYAVKLKIDVAISTVITKHNINELPIIFDTFSKIGIKSNRIAFKNLYSGESDISDLAPTVSEKLEILRRYPYLKNNFSEIPKENNKYHICSAGRNTCSIDYKGNVKPCSLMKTSAGNIRLEDFEDIWNNSELFKIFRSLSIDNMLKCSTCKNKSKCSICVMINLIETGNMFSPSEEFCSRMNSYINYKQCEVIE